MVSINVTTADMAAALQDNPLALEQAKCKSLMRRIVELEAEIEELNKNQ
jgi:hypothetical protein